MARGKRTGTTYHLCIPVQRGIDELVKGNNFLNCTPSQALKILTDYRTAGVEYYTGCSKEDSRGRCKGHASYKQVKDATACIEKQSTVQ